MLRLLHLMYMLWNQSLLVGCKPLPSLGWQPFSQAGQPFSQAGYWQLLFPYPCTCGHWAKCCIDIILMDDQKDWMISRPASRHAHHGPRQHSKFVILQLLIIFVAICWYVHISLALSSGCCSYQLGLFLALFLCICGAKWGARIGLTFPAPPGLH